MSGLYHLRGRSATCKLHQIDLMSELPTPVREAQHDRTATSEHRLKKRVEEAQSPSPTSICFDETPERMYCGSLDVIQCHRSRVPHASFGNVLVIHQACLLFDQSIGTLVHRPRSVQVSPGKCSDESFNIAHHVAVDVV